ncbi:MAG: dihydrolipoyllysine-residue acetyltransferase [Parahaliea sp.]
MAKQQIVVPDIGGAEGAEVIELLVAVGDQVEMEQSLIVLESDKASMEIPSSHTGTVAEILVSVGDELAEGAAILVLESGGEAEAGAPASADESAPEEEGEEGKKEEKVAQDASGGEAEAAGAEGGEGADKVPEPAASSGERELVVSVPDIGTDDAVDLIEISVAVGDTVAEGDSLVVLESDKASMEVPSTAAGAVLEVLAKEGDSVRQGDPLVRLQASAEAPAKPAPAPVAPSTPASSPVAPAKPAGSPGPARGGLIYAGPAVRKLARELGVDLQAVGGSGPRQRILKEDVKSFVKNLLSGDAGPVGGTGIPPIPEVDFAAFGEVKVVARSKMDKVTAANMQRNWLNLPHVTQFDEADITELEVFRGELKGEAERRGTRLTPMPFLLKACAVALRDNPKFNASLSVDGESLVYKQYIHIGMAVDTPAGLLVPVIRDVDQKTLWELAEEVLEMAAKARDRKLRPVDMQGGCFSISSLGGIGGTGFTPIVNAPEVGILAVSRSEVKPRWDGSNFQPRTLLPLGLSYDHRVINGGDAGRFLTQLAGLLGDIRKLLL